MCLLKFTKVTKKKYTIYTNGMNKKKCGEIRFDKESFEAFARPKRLGALVPH
jgi:hypothetical protein